LEARSGHLDVVHANRQEGEKIGPGGIGLGV
jgi:hypothetical protein